MKKTQFKQLVKECISILNEEMYDDKTDMFAPGPRDRTEPSLSSQQQEIPGFPMSKNGEVTINGSPKFVVYSDDSSSAMILGMGNTQGEAIVNAIKNAKMISQHDGVVNENNEKTKKLADQGKKYIQLAKKIAKEEFGV